MKKILVIDRIMSLLFEPYSNLIGITNTNQKNYITPIELSNDTLQYLINNNKIFTKNSEVALFDFPVITVEKSKESRRTTRQSEYMYDVEDTGAELLSRDDNITNFNNGNYHANVNIKIQNIKEPFRKGKISQDIRFVKKNAESLNNGSNICDLALSDYVIKAQFQITNDDGSTEEYMIVGYPEPKSMNGILDLSNVEESGARSNDDNLIFPTTINKIHELQKKELPELMAQFYNQHCAESDKITSKSELWKFYRKKSDYIDVILKEIDDNIELFKSYQAQPKKQNNMGNRNNSNETRKQKLLEEKIAEYKSLFGGDILETYASMYENYRTNYYNFFSQYYNEVVKAYFPRPIRKLTYIFLLYKKEPVGYVPAIFNIREITNKHTPLLERLSEIIERDLPFKNGIITKEEYDSGFRYKLFHSYYRYGDFFFITVKYFHTMSNIVDYSYNYKDSISLSEIIYASTQTNNEGEPFWQTVKLNYNLRYFLIIDSQPPANSRNTLRYTRGTQRNRSSQSRSITQSRQSQTGTRRNINSQSISRTRRNIKSEWDILMEESKIVLVFQESFGKYRIIYKNKKEEFYVLEIQNNFDNEKVYKYILSKINSTRNSNQPGNITKKIVYKCDYNEFATYSFKEFIGFFKILRHEPLDIKDWKLCFVANPIISLNLIPEVQTQKDKLDIMIFIKTNMIYDTYLTSIIMPNVFKLKPILVDNFLNSEKYKNRDKPEMNDCSKLEYEKDIVHYFTAATVRRDKFFNCTIINPNNCGYNFLEDIVPDKDINPKKIRKVVWILPSNNTYKYLKNLTYLDSSSLKMLEEIYKLYINCEGCNNQVFLHITFNMMYSSLHFHIINYRTYIRNLYPINELGSYILKEVNINTLINFITNCNNYYTNSSYSYFGPV